MKRALLTGITGFVGGHLADLLLQEEWEVAAVVRPSSKVSDLPEALRSAVQFYVHDEENELPDIVAASKPSVVFHLASLFLSQHEYEDIADLVSSNVTFGTQLLEAMKLNGCCHFINTGTAWQHYGDQGYNPVNLYAATKQAFYDVLCYYQESAGFKVFNLELFDTYGANDRRKKLLHLFENIATTGKPLDMSLGEQKISLVHVNDVCRAYLLAAAYLLQGRYDLCDTYAVRSEEAITLRELAARYEAHYQVRLNINWGKRPYREREVMQPWSKGRLLPGWRREHRELC